MRNLTRLISLAIFAGIVWAGYWFVGAAATERVLSGWLDARRAAGGPAAAAGLDTRGFPYRFDTTFDGLDLADPGTGVAWSAPVFQILSLSYKPNHVILVWPDEQRLTVPGQSFDVATGQMRASLKVGPSAAVPLETSVLELTDGEVGSSRAWSATLASGQVAMRRDPDAAGAGLYDIALSLSGLAPASEAFTRLRETARLPEVIDTVTAEVSVGFDKPWDRSAIEQRRPQPRDVRLTALSAQWGRLALAGSGAFSVDADGVPTGEIALEATNWRDLVAVAEATGAIPADRVRLVTGALEMLSSLSGDPDRLDVPLRFSGGAMLLGPVPLGPAPRVYLP